MQIERMRVSELNTELEARLKQAKNAQASGAYSLAEDINEIINSPLRLRPLEADAFELTLRPEVIKTRRNVPRDFYVGRFAEYLEMTRANRFNSGEFTFRGNLPFRFYSTGHETPERVNASFLNLNMVVGYSNTPIALELNLGSSTLSENSVYFLPEEISSLKLVNMCYGELSQIYGTNNKLKNPRKFGEHYLLYKGFSRFVVDSKEVPLLENTQGIAGEMRKIIPQLTVPNYSTYGLFSIDIKNHSVVSGFAAIAEGKNEVALYEFENVDLPGEFMVLDDFNGIRPIASAYAIALFRKGGMDIKKDYGTHMVKSKGSGKNETRITRVKDEDYLVGKLHEQTSGRNFS